MSVMSPSDLVLSTSTSYPRVGSFVTWLWARSYIANPRQVHWLFRELRRRHPVDVGQRVRLKTGEWCIVDPFDFIGGEIATRGCYEQETVDFFTRTLTPGMTVIDAGAHIGQYALIASTLVGADGRVYAFEPEPANYARLSQNLVLNERENVVAVNAALSEKVGRLEFNVSHGNSGGHSLGRTKYSGGKTLIVETTTVDTLVAECRVPRVDLLKADVEGAELLILRGAKQTLERFHPILVLECSVHSKGFGYQATDLARFVTSLGYQVFFLDSDGLHPAGDVWPEREYYNIACIPAERAGEWLPR
jgi:FkbM family methyltransferase